MAKSTQLQIRLAPVEKKQLQRLARQHGQSLSAFVLSKVMPEAAQSFLRVLRELKGADDHSYPLAELNDFLTRWSRFELSAAVNAAAVPRGVSELSPFLQNYVAAMVETAALRKKMPAPDWVQDIDPLSTPYFASSMKALRPYLLQRSPVLFKRRNLFVDATLGDRV